MLTYLQALLMGGFQGLSELFPISSLGHSVMIPSLLGWNLDQKDNAFLLFLVATHFATALVLFVFFWKDWLRIFQGLLRSLREREIKSSDADAKLGWMLIVGTIPAGVLGLLFEDQLKTQLAFPRMTAFVLILNGLMLFAAERLRKGKGETTEVHSDERIAQLSWRHTIKVGFLQAIALIPGFSRTGATITGGLLVGLSHEDSARFSFLLATPIIGAAALLKLPELLHADGRIVLGPILTGTLASGVVAYLTVRFLTRYFETKTLKPFAVYCMIAGILASAVLWR